MNCDLDGVTYRSEMMTNSSIHNKRVYGQKSVCLILTAIVGTKTDTLLESGALIPAYIGHVTIHVVRRVRALCNVGHRRGSLGLPADAT